MNLMKLKTRSFGQLLLFLLVTLILFLLILSAYNQSLLTGSRKELLPVSKMTVMSPISPQSGIQVNISQIPYCDLASSPKGSPLLSAELQNRNKAILKEIIDRQYPRQCPKRIDDYWIINVANNLHTKLSIIRSWTWLAEHLLASVALNKTMVYFNYSAYNEYQKIRAATTRTNNASTVGTLTWLYEASVQYGCRTFGMDCYFLPITDCRLPFLQLLQQYDIDNANVNPSSKSTSSKLPSFVKIGDEMAPYRKSFTVPFWDTILFQVGNKVTIEKKWPWQQLVTVALQFLLRFNFQVLKKKKKNNNNNKKGRRK
ncbi:hypothetical protein RFI_29170 [Reticulomyxa filosa]|uniref:Uncharacterized protein n=1 Tax=Reticulomyxa filosa TaxID=46433 RepID=X6M3L5_RETFI|nr:hypothetical protein RFI_29170 [Reticulomyxa filosa]|eukprot:ETO08221.1 hypothetical protein RFI_29170 [Reticulomyxa filosa]